MRYTKETVKAKLESLIQNQNRIYQSSMDNNLSEYTQVYALAKLNAYKQVAREFGFGILDDLSLFAKS